MLKNIQRSDCKREKLCLKKLIKNKNLLKKFTILTYKAKHDVFSTSVASCLTLNSHSLTHILYTAALAASESLICYGMFL